MTKASFHLECKNMYSNKSNYTKGQLGTRMVDPISIIFL